MVTAYKSLLKEKEALKESLSALTLSDSSTNPINNQDDSLKNSDSDQECSNSKNESNLQIATLMNSLATLSAEKSRMEAGFQADKKQLRQEILTKEKIIKEYQDKLKSSISSYQLEIENIRSKLIVERHEREKEQNDHMVMVKELQKLLSDERHLKENLEMQLNDLKSQFAVTNNSDRTIKELSSELDETRKKIKQYELNKSQLIDNQSSHILQQLQSEMTTLKHNHAIALKNEQKRAYIAEERNKKLAAIHEERVANLESRLAELSSTVGNYDRLRQQDQENIFKLKEKIAHLVNNKNDKLTNNNDKSFTDDKMIIKSTTKKVDDIIEEIIQLKKILIIENCKLDEPRDLAKIFSLTNSDDHQSCMDEITKYRSKYEKFSKENEKLIETNENQKLHIKTLQEKVKVLNRNIDEMENELRNKTFEFNLELKQEKHKLSESINSMEMDYRNKLGLVEQQLQKQRERSLLLLEQKENEIKALKTSFDLFIPHTNLDKSNLENSEEFIKKQTSPLQSVLGPSSSTPATNSDSSLHMIHYAQELARKDVEILGLRKAKHSAEATLWHALQDKVATKEELHDKICSLEEQVDR